MASIAYKFKARNKKTKRSFKVQTEKTIRSLIITLCCMVVVLSVTFIFITSQKAQRGYTVQQLKLENESLKAQNGILSQKVTTATSVSDIKEDSNMTEKKASIFITKEDNKLNPENKTTTLSSPLEIEAPTQF